MDPIAERKKRIEELKKKKAQLEAQKKNGSTGSEPSQTLCVAAVPLQNRIRFRNYVPSDATLKEQVDTVSVTETALNYTESMKEATAMPSVGVCEGSVSA